MPTAPIAMQVDSPGPTDLLLLLSFGLRCAILTSGHGGAEQEGSTPKNLHSEGGRGE